VTASDSREEALPVLVSACIADGAIRADVPDPELAALVAEGKVVILKGVLAPSAALALRRAATCWGQATPEYPHGQSPGSTPALNYHRIDDGSVRSAIPHVFHQYGLGALDDLPDDFAEPAWLTADLMKELQNRIAKTNFDVSLTGLRVKLLHYPRGGGFLAEHVHPLEPQRVGLITSLSRLGADFKSGGTTFLTPFGLVDTTEHHDIGDVMIFRYDVAHAVTEVDNGSPIDWTSDSGRWSLVLELRSTHGQSHAKA
jgi:hypothetical protein